MILSVVATDGVLSAEEFKNIAWKFVAPGYKPMRCCLEQFLTRIV